MTRYISILLFSAIAFLMPEYCCAQSHKVCIGSGVEGGSNYIEVFEYDFVSEKPSFPGGDRLLLSYINDNRCYPEEAYNRGIQGKVVCSFVVNRDGSISHVRVLRGVEPSLNREAVRILSGMPLWNPGKQQGEPVPVRVVRTVAFRR